MAGIATSRAVGDVALQVTYTAPDGRIAIDVWTITVISVELTLRTNDELSGDNGVRNRKSNPEMGFPKLGPVKPGDPAECVGFYKNVEIQVHITPCPVPGDWSYNVKRDRQGYWGSRRGAIFVPKKGLHSPGGVDGNTWWDDDKTNKDEDLTPSDLSDGCHIYSVDSPGPGASENGCDGYQDNDIQLVGTNFREWVEINGKQCGNKLLWHATTRIKCTKGKWEYDAGGDGNSVGPDHITIVDPPPMPKYNFTSDRPFSVSLVIDLLNSGAFAERVIGHEMALERFESGKLTAEERKELLYELRKLTGDQPQLKVRDSTPDLAEKLIKVLEKGE